MEQPGPLPGADLADWHDATTGLEGRAFLDAVLAVESARCTRYGRRATFVAVELGGLAELRATWGSEVTDRALRHVAAVLRTGARSSDHLARTGAWSFGLILPETDEIAAVNFVERVRPGCAGALHTAGAGLRCAFGWADTRADRPLEDASRVAVERAREELESIPPT